MHVQRYINDRPVAVGTSWNTHPYDWPRPTIDVECTRVDPDTFVAHARLGGQILFTTPPTNDIGVAEESARRELDGRVVHLLSGPSL